MHERLGKKQYYIEGIINQVEIFDNLCDNYNYILQNTFYITVWFI